MNTLPSGWERKRLEELALIERGKFSVRPRNDPKYFGGEMPFVQTGDISNAKIYLTQYSQTLNESGIRVSKVFPPNSIFITIAANIGDTAITTFETACPDSIVAIQPYQEKVNTYWLNQVLRTKKNDLDAQATQNAQKNINLQVLKSLIINTPPFSEQTKIANILSTWDKAIQTTEQLLANSQQQKKALMQQLLTGKKRLKGFSGEWRETHLRKLLNESRITENVTNDAGRRLTVRLNLKGIERREERGTEAENVTAHFIRRAGQFIYGKQNFHKGAFGIIPKEFDFFETSQDIPTFDFVEKYIVASWFYYFCAQEWFYKSLENYMTGTGSKRLNPKEFLNITLHLPSIEEQQKIAQILSTQDHEIDTLQQKLACLKQEKKALMQKLLSGKVRV
ncbi:TPA: restriction endonuclease subunit S [Pasteurella multocida]|nr:restriction endonuclease subunit S [Pasteurella multocida]